MAQLFFGSPGAGKSTIATMLAKKYNGQVFSNISGLQLKNATVITDDEVRALGEWSPPSGALVIIDESGIIFNNRHWKKFPAALIKFIKLHRHYGVNMIFLSQSFNDIDVTITRLCDRLWYIQKRGPFSLYSTVLKRVKVDKETEQIIDGYRIVSPLWMLLKPLKLIFLQKIFPQIDYHRFCFRPFYYKYFDSFSCDPLPGLDDFRASKSRSEDVASALLAVHD